MSEGVWTELGIAAKSRDLQTQAISYWKQRRLQIVCQELFLVARDVFFKLVQVPVHIQVSSRLREKSLISVLLISLHSFRFIRWLLWLKYKHILFFSI